MPQTTHSCHDPFIFPSSRLPLTFSSQPHRLIHELPKVHDPFATLCTSDAHDLLTNATHVTCLTHDTHVISLMTPRPKHSDAPPPVSYLSTSNTLQTPSLVVCNYLIYDPRSPSSYNYVYDYLYRLRLMTGQTHNLPYASCTPRDPSRTHA